MRPLNCDLCEPIHSRDFPCKERAPPRPYPSRSLSVSLPTDNGPPRRKIRQAPFPAIKSFTEPSLLLYPSLTTRARNRLISSFNFREFRKIPKFRPSPPLLAIGASPIFGSSSPLLCAPVRPLPSPVTGPTPSTTTGIEPQLILLDPFIWNLWCFSLLTWRARE